MRNHRSVRLGASIEVTLKQATESSDLSGLFPPGTRVYLPDLGDASDSQWLAAAKRLNDLGYVPVAHIAARRSVSVEAIDKRITTLVQGAGLRDVLVIGGGLSKPAGTATSSLQIIESGILERNGILDIGIAGHPEGSPDFGEEVALDALRLKSTAAKLQGVNVRIVTQFSFDGDRNVAWANELKNHGIDLPIHFGVAGPAKITTLLKYAVACGIGNSLQFLRKRASGLTALVTNQSPEEVVEPIERHAMSRADTNIAQLHVFAFGGLTKTAEWLHERGSWRS